VKRGREKLHYLNPVPIHEVHARWIAKFERPRLDALAALKQHLEGDDAMTKHTYVYVTYIMSTPEKVWEALTTPRSARATGSARTSRTGRSASRWTHGFAGKAPDVVGRVIEAIRRAAGHHLASPDHEDQPEFAIPARSRSRTWAAR